MRMFCPVIYATLAISFVAAQLPQRPSIPGAVLLPQARPVPFRQQRVLQDSSPPARLRRPPPQYATPAPVRPVFEEAEESPTSVSSIFDDEANKLGISALQSAVRQAEEPEEEQPTRPPVAFRPERPVPVLRQDVRDGPTQRPQTYRQDIPFRQAARQEIREEGQIPVPRPQPVRQHAQIRQPLPPQQPTPQVYRQPQPTRVSQAPRQHSQYGDDGDRASRTRKPPVQILRKYRTDNADGSITWGYENEDGSFKEETLGIDCVTRGKYGYVDPDGVRRDYSYETGNKCDKREEEEALLQPGKQPQPQARKPPTPQPQARPYLAQY